MNFYNLPGMLMYDFYHLLWFKREEKQGSGLTRK